MDIFGIGALEILFILIIALLVLGPEQLVNTGKTIGRFLRKLVMSESWQTIQQASREMRNLPNRLMREAGIEEMEKDFKGMKIEDPTKALNESIKDEMKEINKGLSAWTTTPAAKPTAETASQEKDVVEEESGTPEKATTEEPQIETFEEDEEDEVEENQIAPVLQESAPDNSNDPNNEKGDQ